MSNVNSQTFHSKNLLVGKQPEEILIFGKEKMYVDQFLWFEEKTGIAVAYQVQEKDVKGHFGIMRGVDMIEIFGQSATAACTALVCQKEQATRDELFLRFRFVFVGIDEARFLQQVKTGDILICIGRITSFRFRQITMDGTLYRAKQDWDYTSFFEKYTSNDFQKESIPAELEAVAKFKNLIGRAIKLSKLITNYELGITNDK